MAVNINIRSRASEQTKKDVMTFYIASYVSNASSSTFYLESLSITEFIVSNNEVSGMNHVRSPTTIAVSSYCFNRL